MEQPLDVDRFCVWADSALPALGDGPLTLDRLTGGSSSAVYRISRGTEDAILRMPTWPPRADSLKAMAREARVLEALATTDVPHPHLLGFEAETDLVGVPFMVMQFVEGWIGTQPPPEFRELGSRNRKDMAFAMIDAIAELGKVDYLAVGLGDFGKPEGFLDRQVDRWLTHLENLKLTEQHPGREIPGLDYVADWLRANQPETQRHGLMHCDASFPNVMFSGDSPVRVAAIIDWEIATLGDPLLDLGRAVFSLPGRKAGTGRNRMFDFSDMPTREDLAELYAARTGLDVSALDYYCILAAFKLSIIIEFNYARMVTGRDKSPLAAEISELIVEMIAEAASLARVAG